MPRSLTILHRAAVTIAILFSAVELAFAEAPAPAPIEKTQRIARPLPSLPRNRPPRIGDRGTLVNRRASFVHKIDASNAIVAVEWYSERKELIGDPRRGIAVDRVDNRQELVWLHIKTDGLVEGRMFICDQVLQVTKTANYQTARGQRTVLYLQAAE